MSAASGHEARVHYGPGYRLYFGNDGTELVMLLLCSDKRTQDGDIAFAKVLWSEYRPGSRLRRRRPASRGRSRCCGRRRTTMALTRSFRETVAKRAKDDPAFRAALVEEAMQNLVDGEMGIALAQMRDVVNATMGFDALAAETGIQKTSLMRMLGREGNPRAGNLGGIIKALGRHTGARVVVNAEPVGDARSA